MSVALFTGFPGLLGSALLPRILERAPDNRAICLVQSKFAAQARSRREEILAKYPQFHNRIDLVEGDITLPALGLADGSKWKSQVSDIFHLAALYDLTTPRDIAMRVNANGTSNVLEFAEGVSRLRRIHYVSTCYVSGRCAGPFSEDDLERGQTFNNYYEESKYLAEVAVRARIRRGMPATIYRPAIIVGDSRTGATQKYDGPYFVIRWLLRQPVVALLPLVGNPAATTVNLVPQDFVVEAIAYLSQLEASLGKTYHLADPNPLTVDELVTVIGRATGRTIVRVRLPLRLAKLAIDRVPGVYRLMQIPSHAIDYFAHPTRYRCHKTLAALEGSGLQPPPFPAYVDRLVDYVRRHPAIGAEAMA